MPNQETLLWMLTGIVALLSLLSGAIWNMVRAEHKEHSELIKSKADSDRVHEMESRWTADLEGVKSSNEKLIDKLSQRHDREIDSLSTRLGDQIKTSEQNILAQMRILAGVISGAKQNDKY